MLKNLLFGLRAARPIPSARLWWLLVVLGLLLGNAGGAWAQNSANYAFSTATNGSLALDRNSNAVDMSTGTTLLVASSSDQGVSAVTTLPFTFVFMGKAYTQFSTTANGLVGLGSTAVAGGTYTVSTGTATAPLISAFAADLGTGTTGKIHYKVVGSAPNRVVVVEFLNMGLLWTSAYTNDGTYQVRLYEGTGVVDFVYGGMNYVTGVNATNANVSIGFAAGNTAGALASILSATNANTNNLATFGTNTYANASGVIPNLNSAADGLRRVYTFTPPSAPLAPSAITFASVTSNSFTVNFTDNSTNESGFLVERSTDNVTFATVATLAANTITLAQTGLSNGTLYYYRVSALNEGRSSAAATGQQATTAGTLCGTGGIVPVGPTGTYTSLTAAFAALGTLGVCPGGTVFELQSGYTLAAEASLPIAYTFTAGSASNTVTVRPATGASLTLSTPLATSTAVFNINGGRNFILDGRPGGVNGTTTNYLSVTNTNTGGAVIQFASDASANTVQYCQLRGVNTSATSGVVLFTAATGTTGNNNNTLQFNSIAEGTTTPTNLIYSAGTSSTNLNSNNRVLNNNLANFFSATAISTGVLLASGNTGWTISGNTLYQSASRTFTSTVLFNYGIKVDGGTGYTINNNNFGGGVTAVSGAPQSAAIISNPYTVSGSTGRLYPIQATFATTGSNTIAGNTIKGLDFVSTTSGATPVFIGINVTAGNATIGGASAGLGNTVGDAGSAASINLRPTGTCLTHGISYSGSSTVVISNNTVGGISAGVTGNNISQTINGIIVSSGTATINNNTVGSTTQANSLNGVNNGIGASAQLVRGIVSTATTTSITANTVANLNSAYLGTGGGQVLGVVASSGVNTITGNTVRDLSNASPNGSNSASATVIGIAQTATTTGGQTVSQNTVYNLSSTSATAVTSTVIGIFYSGPTTGTNALNRNLIYNLSQTTPYTSALTATAIVGLQIAAGTGDVTNNMIRLGFNASGAALTTGYDIRGISKTSSTSATNTNNFYHNSVYIGGTAVVSGLQDTWAFRRSNDNVDALRNNVLVNARSNASGTGRNFAVGLLAAATTYTSSHNVYFVPGTGGNIGLIGSTAYASLSAWQGVIAGGDASSANADPQFIAPTATTPDLHINATAATPVEATGLATATVADDYDGQTRSGLTPVDIGADAGAFTPGDLVAPTITYTALVNTNSTANRSLSAVAITDAGGVNTTAGTAPRLYFRRVTAALADIDANVINGNTNATDGWKYVEANGTTSPFDFTINYALLFTGNAAVQAGQRIQYFVVAQDAAANVGLNAGTFATAPASVTLATANLPTGTNSYLISFSFAGNYNVGAAQTYTSLTNAGGLFEALNNGVVTGAITASITSDLAAELGTFALNQLTEQPAASGFVLTIQPDATTERLITGNGATGGMIRLNGADNVVINGGIGKYLRLRNTGSSSITPTVAFVNDAKNNTLTNCTIEGSGTALASATILFSTTTGPDGNDGNTVSNNDIRELSVSPNTVPTAAIYSLGTAGATNSGNVVKNNTIRNFLSNGVLVAATGNGDGWVIGGATAVDGNRLYQEAARSLSLTNISLAAGNGHTVGYNSVYQTNGSNTGSFTGISVSAGNGHTISFNTIGGAAADASGASLTVSGTLYGLNLALATGTASSVQGNVVRNFTNNGTSSTSYGISLSSGAATIGTAVGNVIGDATAALGVRVKYDAYGIFVSSTSATSISNNQVRNLQAVSGTGVGTFLTGIYASGTGAAHTVLGNTVAGVISASVPDTSVGFNAQTIGLLVAATGAVTVNGNQISNVGNTATSGAGSGFVHFVAGMISSDNAVGSVIRNNRIWDIFASSTGTGTNADNVYGLSLQGTSSATVANNQVSLATLTSAAPVTLGIVDLGTGTNTYAYNSVYLSGAGSSSTYAFRRSSSSTLTLRNNLLYNERTGAGSNFAISTSSITGWAATTSNNNYFVTADATKMGDWGGTAKTLAGWQAAQTGGSGGDAASFSETSGNLSAATLFTSAAAGNLKINPAYYPTLSVLESKGVAVSGITTDFEGDARPGPAGSLNGGGSAPDIGADEFDGTPAQPMSYVSSTVTQVTGNVAAGQTNQAIIRVAVVTKDQLNPLTLTQLVLNANGTSPLASINGPAKVYYTGTSSTFSTTTLFGSATPTLADYPVTGTQVLQAGTNYFFVAYDIAAGATVGNTFDAEATSLTLTVGGTPTVYTPTVTAPAGNRAIVGPLAGTYTVGQPNVTYTTPDYLSISAAIADLKLRGVSAAVTFSLINPAATPYNAVNGETFPLALTAVTGSSSTNTVTFKPAAGVQPQVVNATVSHTFTVTSAANYVFDGSNTTSGISRDLTISNTSTTATAHALVWLASTTVLPISNVQVRNLTLQGAANGSANTSAGMMVSNTTYNVATGANANSIVLNNNSVQGTSFGIVVGNGTTPGTGLQITNNLLGPVTAAAANNLNVFGLFVQQATAPIITGNTVQNVIATTSTVPTGMRFPTGVTGATVSQNVINNVVAFSSDAFGMLLGTGFTGATVSRNQVLNITGGTGTRGGHGIDINATGSTTANLTLSNNFVGGIGGTGATSLTSTTSAGMTGIRVYNGTQGGINLYYNSVNLTGTASATTASLLSAALYVGSATTALDIRNNIFVNSLAAAGSTGAKAYAINSASANTAFGTTGLNYNNYFVSGTQGVLGAMNGIDAATFAAFKTASGQDANSLNLTPGFVSATDLHATNTDLTVGTPITGITVDIDGATRSAISPSIGADELPPVAVDARPTALVAPAPGSGCYTSAETVKVTVRNASTSTPLDFTTNAVTVTVNVSGTVTQTFTTTVNTNAGNSGGNPLAVGATVDITLPGTLDMSALGTYNFDVSATANFDGNTANDLLATQTSTVTAPTLTSIGASPTTSCGAATVTLTATGAVGGTVTWYASTDNFVSNVTLAGTGTPLTLTGVSVTTSYRANVVCGATTSANSSVATVTVTNPTVTVISPVTRCGAGDVTLQASASAGSTAYYYATATSVLPLGSGATQAAAVTATPATQTFYAAARDNNTAFVAGLASNSATNGTLSSGSDYPLGFALTAAGTLQSVDIYPATGTTSVTIQLIRLPGAAPAAGTVVAGSSVVVPISVAQQGTLVTVPLNYYLTAGNYKITNSSGSVARYSTYTGTYPLTNGPLSVTGSYNSTSSTVYLSGPVPYNSFFNLTFMPGCESARTAITVNVTTPPTLSYTGTPSVCAGSSTTLTFSPTSYTTLTVSPTTGAVVSGGTVTFSPTATATYTITGNDGTGAAGCTATATATITVNPAPNAPTLTPAAPGAICAGNSTVVAVSSNAVTLTNQVVLATATFDGGADGFTVTTTGSVPATAFTRVTAGYGIGSGSGTAYNGPSGAAMGGYYVADSDKGSSGTATTNTTLVSPVFSTVKYTAATLSFQQYYRSYSSDVFYGVEYTTNGGITWLNVATYTSTATGTVNLATQPVTTAALPAGALNQVSVQVRFRYQSSFGYYVALDNVGVTGTLNEAPAFAVTPTTGASVSGSNITFNPTTTTTYNVTATYPSSPGCPSPATPITITVNPLATADAGPATAAVCAGYTYSTVGTFGGSATQATYTSSGTGTFSNGGVIDGITTSVTYSPSASDLTAGNVTLTLTPNSPTGCATTDQLALTLSPTTTWTGAANGEWNNPANWSGGCVPNLQLNALVPAGTTNSPSDLPYVSGPGPANAQALARNLTIAAGAFIELYAHDLDLSGNLVNNGTMYLTYEDGFILGRTLRFVGATAQTAAGMPKVFNLAVANTGPATVTVTSAQAGGSSFDVVSSLTMTSGLLNLGTTTAVLSTVGSFPATIAETENSYVLGRVRTERTLSSAGPEDFGGLGLVLNPAASSTALPGLTTVTRSTGTFVTGAGTSQSVLRQYRVVPTVDAGLNVAMSFNYFTHELNGTAVGNVRLFSATIPAGGGASSGPWSYYTASTLASTPTGGTAGTVTLAGLTHLSDWTLGGNPAPLPVSLTRFEAIRRNADAELSWATASEKNNAGFEVQVSTDGRVFRTLHTMEPASANSTAPREYGYLDRTAGKAGLRYYRLRQLDLDGTATLSPVRTLRFEGASAALGLSAAPNPFRERLTLSIALPAGLAGTSAELRLSDAAGRVLSTQRLAALPAGSSEVAMPDVARLSSGVYFVQLSLPGQPAQHLKVVKE